MKQFKSLSESEKSAFERDGYVIIRSMFSKEETTLLMEVAENDNVIRRNNTEGRIRMAIQQNLPFGIR